MPIPGTNTIDRVDENPASVKVVLTPEDLREIEVAASRIEVQGARLSEGSPSRTALRSATRTRPAKGYDYMALRGPAAVLHDLIVDSEHRGRGVGQCC